MYDVRIALPADAVGKDFTTWDLNSLPGFQPSIAWLQDFPVK